MNRFPLSKNTSQRKYPDIMIRIFNLFCKLNEIKISDQEWFEKTFEKSNLWGQVCPYCNSKEQMLPHDTYSRYMITIKGNRIESVLLRIPRVKCTSCGHTHAVLTDQEVSDYIRQKIRNAGGSSDIIDTAAISSVHSYSQGNPRLIDNVMTDAMTLGSQMDKKVIDAEVMLAAINNQALS